MARIFISYRRRDSAYVAGNLRDALQARFGTDSCFLDIDNIPFGADFRQYIGNAVGQCDVLLVLIGDQWLESTDDQGRRRIEDPSDYVRIEIESALKRNIPVVPVLVGEAKVPGASELPESIRDMAYRNAAEIRATRDQKNQIERLVSGLAEHLREKVSGAEEEKPAAPPKEEPSARQAREAMAQPKMRESVEPKPSVEVSDTKKEKSAAPAKEEPSVPKTRKTIVQPKLPKLAKPKPKAPASAAGELRAERVALMSLLQKRAGMQSAAAKSKAATSRVLDRRSAFLKEARKVFKGITHNSLYLGGAIPPEKASAATKAYASGVSQDAIMLLYDNTVFGGAKDGLLLTVDAIYWRNSFADLGHCRYVDLKRFSVRKNLMGCAKLVVNTNEIYVAQGPGDKIAQATVNLIRNWKAHLG